LYFIRVIDDKLKMGAWGKEQNKNHQKNGTLSPMPRTGPLIFFLTPFLTGPEQFPSMAGYTGTLYTAISPWLIPFEGAVKGHAGGEKVYPFYKFITFRSPEDTIHAGVFPFHRERASITGSVKLPDNTVKVNISVSQGNKIPGSPGIPERKEGTQDTPQLILEKFNVLHVDMVDPAGKLPNKDGLTHPLPYQVAGIEIQP
jgi:hypothetical protein